MGVGTLVFAVLLAILIVDRVFRRYATRKIADIFENVPPFNVQSEASAPDARDLSFRTSDGLRLSGSLHLPPDQAPQGLVVFFPELNGNHWMARRYCEALLNDGFAILAMDFRSQGTSDRQPGYVPIHWVTEFEMTDVAAVLEYIESDPQLSTLPLLAFGVSRGGVVALLAGARYPRFQAVIADSAFGTMPMIFHFVNRFVRYVIPTSVYRLLPQWHVRITLRQGVQLSETRRNCRYVHLEDEVSGLTNTPVLLISGLRDSYVIPDIAQQLCQLIGKTAVLWTVAGAKHNMSRLTATDEYDRRIVQHFRHAVDRSEVTTSRAAEAAGLDSDTAVVASTQTV